MLEPKSDDWMTRRWKCFWLELVDASKPTGPWIRRDIGETYRYATFAPPGAIYNAIWLMREGLSKDYLDKIKRYPDGLILVVVTPHGPWVIDGPSFNGTAQLPCPWTRTGDPRKPETFSVHPSINFPGQWHGWLKNGELYPA